MKRSGWLSAALLSALLTLSPFLVAQKNTSLDDTNAAACGADASRPPSKSFARAFSGGWSPVSDEQRSAPTWSQTAAVWPRTGGGTFVQLWMLDEPSSATWSERIDYCFGPDGAVLWIDTRYNQLEADTRIDHFEFNAVGTVTKHTEQCVNTGTEEARPADERCKDSSAFPIVKHLEDFSFLRKPPTKVL